MSHSTILSSLAPAGSCLPSLETMYPYAHYKYMLGKVNDEKVKADFLSIETDRVAGYLAKTRYV